MKHRVIETALTLSWTLAACQRGGGDATNKPGDGSPSGPGPITEVDGDGSELPIVLVPQKIPSESGDWLFDPSGRRMASTEFLDCSIWDIGSGRLIRSYEDVAATPCTTWQPAASLFDFHLSSSADQKLDAETTPSGVEISESKTGRVQRTLACKDCYGADDWTWSMQGHQLAFAWADPPRIELWDADTGKRVRAESIPISGEVLELQLGWTEAGAAVAWTARGLPEECDPYDYDSYDCEYDETTQTHTTRPLDTKILVVSDKRTILHAVGTPGGAIDSLWYGPRARWVAWTYEWSERRGGTTIETHFVNLADSEDKAGWEYYSDYSYDDTIEREGHWRDDGLVHWVGTVSYAEYGGSITRMHWEDMVMSPPVGLRSGELFGHLEYDADVEIELFGVTDSKVNAIGSLREGDEVIGIGPMRPPDCTILDIGSGERTELLDCGTMALVRNASGSLSLSLDPELMEWWWGRSGALAIFDGQTFMLIDATGKPKPRKDVTGVVPLRLGAELDRLVVLTAAGMELIDMSSGAAILKLAKLAPAELALSPNGDRLAMRQGSEVSVLALPSGERLASWKLEGELELGFRQDGKVLFAGENLPELAFDPATGEQLSSDLEWILDAYADDVDLDPTWRWLFDNELRTITRVIDGLTLALQDGGAYLPNTGQYVGPIPTSAHAFRIGSDPWAVPVFETADLDKWLVRDDLIEAFLLGKPIAPPKVTAAEATGLNALIQAEQF